MKPWPVSRSTRLRLAVGLRLESVDLTRLSQQQSHKAFSGLKVTFAKEAGRTYRPIFRWQISTISGRAIISQPFLAMPWVEPKSFPAYEDHPCLFVLPLWNIGVVHQLCPACYYGCRNKTEYECRCYVLCMCVCFQHMTAIARISWRVWLSRLEHSLQNCSSVEEG